MSEVAHDNLKGLRITNKKYEKKTPTFLQKHVSEGEVKSPYFLQVW
jgi:hypothetical protein